jgi:hypothetical protein
MANPKIKGLIAKEGRELSGGLIGNIVHHTGARKLRIIAISAGLAGESSRLPEMLETRGKMLEQDMTAINRVFKDILDIAKEKGYEDIREIIEDREYADSVDSPTKPENKPYQP